MLRVLDKRQASKRRTRLNSTSTSFVRRAFSPSLPFLRTADLSTLLLLSKNSQRSLVKYLIALRVRLSTAHVGWVQDFLANAHGLEALEALLGKIVSKQEKGTIPSEEEKSVQGECVKCLRALMNTDVRAGWPPARFSADRFLPQLGFGQVLTHPSLVIYLTYSLYSPSAKLRALVADVLAALCVLSSEEGHALVLSAFSDARVSHNEKFRFEHLVDSIKLPEHSDDETSDGTEGDDEDEAGVWEWRTAAMALVNALTNTPNELEERMMLRDEFTRRGLNEAITVRPFPSPLSRS